MPVLGLKDGESEADHVDHSQDIPELSFYRKE